MTPPADAATADAATDGASVASAAAIPAAATAATAATIPDAMILDPVIPEAKSPEDARLMAHSYDGIREYDNPLPGWWRAIFWGSIVFAAGYWVWFHVGKWGQTPEAQYQAAYADYQEGKAARDEAEAKNVSEDALARNAKDPGVVEHGAAVFATRCVACHTENGRGLIGPNLTDLYQLHGSTRLEMYATIKRGVPGTAMLAWGEQMPATDVVAVTAFVSTLRGKNIPGKEPQGQPVEPFK